MKTLTTTKNSEIKATLQNCLSNHGLKVRSVTLRKRELLQPRMKAVYASITLENEEDFTAVSKAIKAQFPMARVTAFSLRYLNYFLAEAAE